MPGKHSATISGSIAERRIMCPGSYRLQLAHPDVKDEESGYAAEGTAMHKAMEFLIDRDTMATDAAEALGFTAYRDIVITEEHVEAKLQPALDAFHELVHTYMGGRLDFEVEAEAHVPIPAFSEGGQEAYGKLDICGVGDNSRMLVLDWKFGDGIRVSPVRNKQLMFYALCAWEDDRNDLLAQLFGPRRGPPPEITFAIIQPMRGTDAPALSVWETPWRGVMDQFSAAIKKAADNMKMEDAAKRAGSWCRWCPVQRHCPLQRGTVDTALAAAPPGDMDPLEIAAWLDKVSDLEGFIKALRAHAHKELERGVQLPRFKLVATRPARRYKDAGAAALLLEAEIGDAAYKKTVLTPPQAEAKLGKPRYAALLEPHVEKVSSGTKIVADTDPGPDVSNPGKRLGDKLKALAPVDGVPPATPKSIKPRTTRKKQ